MDTQLLEKNKGYIVRVKRRGMSLIFPADKINSPIEPKKPGEGVDDDGVTPSFPLMPAVDECSNIDAGQPECYIRAISNRALLEEKNRISKESKIFNSLSADCFYLHGKSIGFWAESSRNLS